MVAVIAALPKEKEKCLENGDKEEKVAATSERTEKMTCKKFIKLLIGFFVFISLIVSYMSIFSSVRSVLPQKSDYAAKHCAGIIIVATAILTVLYCYFREAYKALSTEISTQMAVIFSPYSEMRWHYAIAKSTALSLHYLFVGLSAQILQWCLVTLIYGAEISSNLLKSQLEIGELANTTFNETEWGRNRTLSRSFYIKCIGGWPMVLLLFTMPLFVSVVEQAAKSKHAKKQAEKVLWFLTKVCGSEFIEIYWHMLCLQILSTNIDIFPVLSGWITQDSLDSFNIFTSFFLIVLPIYLLYFLSCCFMELVVFWMHSGRNEKRELKLSPLQPLNPSVA